MNHYDYKEMSEIKGPGPGKLQLHTLNAPLLLLIRVWATEKVCNSSFCIYINSLRSLYLFINLSTYIKNLNLR